MKYQRITRLAVLGTMMLASGAAAGAQSARDACADAARALVRQQPSWDDTKSRGGDTLRWRAADGSRGICRVDARGRVYEVEVEQWGSDDIWIDGGSGLSTERDRDRRGADYTSMTVRSLGACQDACSDDRRCRAYTFDEGDRRCFLKSSVPPAQFARGKVSGVKGDSGGSGGSWDGGGLTTERGVNRPGGDYRSYGVRSLDDCRDACRREDRCRAYTFDLPSRTCYLKDRVPQARDDDDRVSGYKDR